MLLLVAATAAMRLLQGTGRAKALVVLLAPSRRAVSISFSVYRDVIRVTETAIACEQTLLQVY